jgi:hypothetical protein
MENSKTTEPESTAAKLDDSRSKRRKAIKTVRHALALGKSLPLKPHHQEASTALSGFKEKLSDAWGPDAPISPRMRLLLFHYPLPDDMLAYQSGDLKMDLSEVNFEWVIERTIRNLLGTLPEAEVVLLTDQKFLTHVHFERLRVVRLELNAQTPMFNRVALYAAYTHSRHFNVRTAMLDSDIFVLRSLDPLYHIDFDIAVTFRSAANLMSVNEGVILTSPRRKSQVEDWFFRYLNVYCALSSSEEMAHIYPNIRKWRGGQLSLNLMCGGLYFYQSKIEAIDGVRVAFLPCNLVNRSLDASSAADPTLLQSCYALHLKGARKKDLRALDQLLERQRLWAALA